LSNKIFFAAASSKMAELAFHIPARFVHCSTGRKNNTARLSFIADDIPETPVNKKSAIIKK
jgi:hypothetical protein